MSEIRTPEPVVEQALDIQHDPFPAEDHGIARRIPHLGHVLLLLVIVGFSVLVSFVIFAAATHGHPLLRENAVVAVAVEALTDVIAIAASLKIFPLLWKRPFWSGIEWNALAARRNWPRLLSAAVLLSVLAQVSEHFVTAPKNPEIDKLMDTPAGAWSVVFLGVVLAPLCEEVAFRGFLLPALATAYDWLSLDRTPAGLRRWMTTTGHTTPAKVFAALLSSICFALLHAAQNQYAWGVVTVLFGVGLALAYVRLRLNSVASSTAVHMAYNSTIFVAVLIATHGFRHLERLQH